MIIEISDVKDYQDAPPWRSYDLFTEGETLEELLDNAIYFMIDQDGGSLGEESADDELAERLITEKWQQASILRLIKGGGR